MKASILAVGTELTTGQIVNQNAAMLSAKLKSLGFITVLHITVPDDRKMIQDALKLCARESDLLFVTGGLGPTTDDFTRDLITEWANEPLKFDEASWKKVQDRLSSRGMPVHDFQKQQCFFPQSAKILENADGTANAFYLNSQAKHLWALPGPPREIEAVWRDHIEIALKKFPVDPYITSSWDLIGLGENQVAHIVEPLVQNSGFEIGYRVHLPFVEVKLSYYKSESSKAKAFVDKVTAALKTHTVARDGEDLAHTFCTRLEPAPHLVIIDELTQGLLLKRLQPHLKNLLKKSGFTYTQNSQANIPGAWTARLQAIDELSCKMTFQNFEISVQAPYTSPLMRERRVQYFTEMFFIEAVKFSKSK